MHVLLTSIYYPPRLGGIENHVHHLAHTLAGAGCQVSVVTSRSEPGSPAYEQADGVSVHRVPLVGRHALGWMLNAAASIPAALRAARGCDVVHAHTFQSVVPALPTLLSGKRPLVVTIHSSHFLKMIGRRHWRMAFAALLCAADLILAPSQELADACRRVAPGKRVETIVNAIDTRRFTPTTPALARRDGRAILVATRRLVEKNGVRYLIDAMPEILSQVPADLYLVGIGPERADLDARVARHGIGGRVHFLGGVQNDALPPILSSADAVVMPSLLEATSLSCLEAMACERPVAVSRVGGLPELVDAGCGVLFEPADPGSLARAVIELLARPESERRALGAEGRRRVLRRWSLDAFTETHLGFYRELLGHRSA